uniref:Uncharacterized protein n=1 Tax=Oryza meridionalis TaxID=40149 RepID=A0A0E0FCB7_9ORYZ
MAAAAEVEPAALAYIRHLAEELEDTAFEDACFDQADEFNDGDLPPRSPPPSRALDGVEDLLWKGSPMLAAYARQDACNRRLEQENMVAATAAAVADTGAAVDACRTAIAARLPRLRALRARLAALTTTASAVVGNAEEVTGAVEAEEETAKLEAMGPELPGLAEDVGVRAVPSAEGFA